MWKYYAVLSAVFAGMTAVLAKMGMKGVSGNLATAIRTVVILFIAWGIVLAAGQFKDLKSLTKTTYFSWDYQVSQQVFPGYFILRH